MSKEDSSQKKIIPILKEISERPRLCIQALLVLLSLMATLAGLICGIVTLYLIPGARTEAHYSPDESQLFVVEDIERKIPGGLMSLPSMIAFVILLVAAFVLTLLAIVVRFRGAGSLGPFLLLPVVVTFLFAAGAAYERLANERVTNVGYFDEWAEARYGVKLPDSAMEELYRYEPFKPRGLEGLEGLSIKTEDGQQVEVRKLASSKGSAYMLVDEESSELPAKEG